jgi:hypothetical protein
MCWQQAMQQEINKLRQQNNALHASVVVIQQQQQHDHHAKGERDIDDLSNHEPLSDEILNDVVPQNFKLPPLVFFNGKT